MIERPRKRGGLLLADAPAGPGSAADQILATGDEFSPADAIPKAPAVLGEAGVGEDPDALEALAGEVAEIMRAHF